jgi:hypothetical protein
VHYLILKEFEDAAKVVHRSLLNGGCSEAEVPVKNASLDFALFIRYFDIIASD